MTPQYPLACITFYFDSADRTRGGTCSMATFAPGRAAFNPAIPQTFSDLGGSESLVLDLVLRRMLIEGFSSLAGLSRSLRISIPIVDIVFKHMRAQQLVEVKGMTGNDYNFGLSQAGKQLAGERFQVS